MIMVFFIFYIVFALLCLFSGLIYKTNEANRSSFGMGILFTICVIVAVAIGSLLWGEETIKPIDVYRGKTTLEITYRDSVAIDSVVVWK